MINPFRFPYPGGKLGQAQHIPLPWWEGLGEGQHTQYLALRMQNERIQQEAQSKALLLDEVNHRVNNNLTALMALFDLEMASAAKGVKDFQTTLRDVRSRLGSIVKTHNLLSQTAWRHLPLEDLVGETIHAALRASPLRQPIAVTMSLPLQRLVIAPKQAFTLALILNELVTNSAKHAFQGRERGHIQVTIVCLDGEDGQRLRLTYQDDGPGWPEAILEGKAQNTGLHLVHRSTAYTLGGELKLYNNCNYLGYRP